MNEDLIRRSDAIKAINGVGWLEDAEYEERILAIPTIEPKRGEWVFKTIFPNDKSEFPMGYLECSVCGSHHKNATPCNYCDNCGARMKGADDE